MYPNINHQFCRLCLKKTREEMKAIGFKHFPKREDIEIYKIKIGSNKFFEVRFYGKIVWDGVACCAWDAKENALQTLVTPINI